MLERIPANYEIRRRGLLSIGGININRSRPSAGAVEVVADDLIAVGRRSEMYEIFGKEIVTRDAHVSVGTAEVTIEDRATTARVKHEMLGNHCLIECRSRYASQVARAQIHIAIDQKAACGHLDIA